MVYINYFFFYSIIGHFMESIIYLFEKGKSGILYGYWTPIYGIGCVLLLFLYDHFISKTKRPYFNIFITGFFVLSIIEWLGGTLIEKIFHKVFWSYHDLKFHLGNYVSLEISLIWALLSMFVLYLKKYLDPYMKKVPIYITIIFFCLFSGDVFCTILFYFQTKFK